MKGCKFLKILTNNPCKYSRHFTEVSLNMDPQPLITQICKNIEHVEFTSNFDQNHQNVNK